MDSCERCKYRNKREHEEPCVGCTHNAVENFEPMTNADRIRSMTDEELAKWIFDAMPCGIKDDCLDEHCDKCIEKWLKSEVGCE